MRFKLPALLTLVVAAGWSVAHDLDVTTIRLTAGAVKTHLTLETPLSRLVTQSSLGVQPTPAEIDAAIRSRIRLSSKGSSQPLPTSADLDVDGARDVVRWEVELSADASTIEIDRPFDTSTGAARTLVIKGDSTEVVGTAKTGRPSVALVSAGMSHVLSGLDHVLFVLGMTLLVGSFGAVLRVLTAFTVAHSISLACAVLGWTSVSPRIVEPLIALSIVALAIEGIVFGRARPDRKRWHWAMALGFGLVHGLGFAGGLSAVGLSRGELPIQLFGFSVGIESAQILVAGIALILALVMGRATSLSTTRLNYAACLALGMVGSFWFMERLV